MIQKVSFIQTNQSTINFLNWENAVFIQGISRFSTAGQAGSCKLLLGHHYGSELQQTTYSLHSIRNVA